MEGTLLKSPYAFCVQCFPHFRESFLECLYRNLATVAPEVNRLVCEMCSVRISLPVSNTKFCVSRAVSSSLSLLIRMMLGIMCWCYLICLIDCSGDGLVVVSVCAVSVVYAVSLV